MSQSGHLTRLEPDDAKVSRPVLRGGGGGNTASLPGDQAGRLITVTRAGLATAYTWNDRGDLLDDGTQQYTWGAAGRLVGVSVADGPEVAYLYDGANERTAMVVAGVTTTYVVDPFNMVDHVSQVLIETAAGEAARNLYGLDLVAQARSTATTYLGYDAMSVRLHLNEDGDLTDAYRYGPFGEKMGASPTGYGFSGEEWDETVGLLYLRARYYAPEVGRFVSRDPLEGISVRPISFQRFLYATNPINYTDPSGMWPLEPGFAERARVTKAEIVEAGGLREYLVEEDPAMVMARTMWGENGVQGLLAMRHVGWIVKIRAEAGIGVWNGYYDVMLSRQQFLAWRDKAAQPGNIAYDTWAPLGSNLREMLDPATGPGLNGFEAIYISAKEIYNAPLYPLPPSYVKYRHDQRKCVIVDSFDQAGPGSGYYPPKNCFKLRSDKVHWYHSNYEGDDFYAFPCSTNPCDLIPE